MSSETEQQQDVEKQPASASTEASVATAASVSEPVPKSDSEPSGDVNQVSRNSALMSVLVIISRLTGFMRTWGQAYAIGVTVMASCYSVANNLPELLYELVAAGMLTTAFLPVYMSVKKRAGTEGANEYTSNLVSLSLIVMIAVTILGFIFAEPLVYTQSFSATEEFDFDLTVYFFRFFVIDVVLYTLSSIFSGVLNAERDYLWSTAAPIFNNIVTTISFFAYAALADTNPSLALIILAVGNPLGVGIQVVMQIPSMLKHGIRLHWRVDIHDPDLRDTLKIGIPSLVVMIANFIVTSVQSSSVLSVDATGASIAYYARLWYTLPYAILTVPITTTMFTELSDSWSRGDTDAFKNGINSGLRQILFFMLPFMMYLMVFSIPLISIMAGDSFTEAQIITTAEYLSVYALSLPLYGICMYFQKVCSSMREMKLYAAASVAGTVLQVWLMLSFTTTFGLNFVPFTILPFYIVVDSIILISLRRKLGHFGLRGTLVSALKSFVLGLLGAIAGALVLYGLTNAFGSCMASPLLAFVYTVAGGIVSLIVTYGLAFVIKMPETSIIKGLVKKATKR